jgi:hypothetical protein
VKTQQRLVVISEGGRVVGTQLVTARVGRQPGASATLVAGPRQQRHEIEIEVPARFASPAEVDAFHQLVAGRLGLKP